MSCVDERELRSASNGNRTAFQDGPHNGVRGVVDAIREKAESGAATVRDADQPAPVVDLIAASRGVARRVS